MGGAVPSPASSGLAVERWPRVDAGAGRLGVDHRVVGGEGLRSGSGAATGSCGSSRALRGGGGGRARAAGAAGPGLNSSRTGRGGGVGGGRTAAGLISGARGGCRPRWRRPRWSRRCPGSRRATGRRRTWGGRYRRTRGAASCRSRRPRRFGARRPGRQRGGGLDCRGPAGGAGDGGGPGLGPKLVSRRCGRVGPAPGHRPGASGTCRRPRRGPIGQRGRRADPRRRVPVGLRGRGGRAFQPRTRSGPAGQQQPARGAGEEGYAYRRRCRRRYRARARYDNGSGRCGREGGSVPESDRIGHGDRRPPDRGRRHEPDGRHRPEGDGHRRVERAMKPAGRRRGHGNILTAVSRLRGLGRQPAGRRRW